MGRERIRLEFIAIAFLYIFSIARIAAEFVDQNYNWDVDTYIYYGQELRRGNPLWLSEWTGDPLVVRDFLLAIPSAFEPLLTWRLISVGSAVLAVICVVLLLPGFLTKTGYPEWGARRASILSGGLYLLVSGHMPGGFTQINVLPTSAAIISLLVGFAMVRERRKRWEVFAIAITAGLAAAVSISVRPYFFFPLAMGFVVIGLMILGEKKLSSRQKSVRVSALLLSPTIIGFGLNLAPWLFLGKVGEFFSQLSFMFETPPNTSNSIIDALVNPDYGINPVIRLWLAGGLMLSAVEIGIHIQRRSGGLGPVLIPLSALMTAIGILSSHFWDHYVNFFSWYFSIILATRLFLTERKASSFGRFRYALFVAPSVMFPIALSALAAFVLIFGVGPTATAPRVTELAREHPNLVLAQALESKFSSGFTSRPLFLAPRNPYVHWKLEESRHGFPNVHHTGYILRGAWASLPERSHTFRTPKNSDEYCVEIRESSVQVVVLDESSVLQPCFGEVEPRWRYEQISVSGTKVWNLWWRQ